MMGVTGGFSWLTTTASLWITGVALLATVVLCFVVWQRSGFSKRIAALEFIRFMIVCLALATLNQPEWVFDEPSRERPVVAVLWDGSGSMATRDVVDPGDPTAPPMSRAEWTDRRMMPEAWAKIGSDVDVVIEPFSLRPDDTPGRASDLATPLGEMLDRYSNLRAVVMYSDGDWNEGIAPLDAAMRYRTQKIPVFVAAVGSADALPDIEVASIDVPTFAVVGKTLQIPFTIRSAMPVDVEARVSLFAPDGEVISKNVMIPAKGYLEESMAWTARRAGTARLTVKVPEEPGELDASNNELTVDLEVREEALRILLIESYPRWEYRYMRNAMVRDPGVEVACLLFHPDLKGVGGGPSYIESFPTRSELAKFDVIFLGDVGTSKGMLTFEQCRMLKGVVQEQASGLIFMPGFRGHQVELMETELKDLYPVELDPTLPGGAGSPIPGSFSLTTNGRRSLLTKLADEEKTTARIWEAFPGFQWYAAAIRAAPGAEVLAVHRNKDNEYGRLPLIVTKVYGAGKVLYMGTDSVWKWREGVEDRYHYRFWGQVSRWMAYQRKMAAGENMRLFYVPDRPLARHRVTLNANVMGPNGSPLDAGTVVARITGPEGETETVRLKRQGEGEWGLFKASFEPREPGRYEVVLRCEDTDDVLETTIDVVGIPRERVGQPARPEVLEEISRVTRGEMIDRQGVDQVVRTIRALPEPPAVSRRFRLWANPWWGGFMIVLMGAFWIGRKMVGRI